MAMRKRSEIKKYTPPTVYRGEVLQDGDGKRWSVQGFGVKSDANSTGFRMTGRVKATDQSKECFVSLTMGTTQKWVSLKEALKMEKV